MRYFMISMVMLCDLLFCGQVYADTLSGLLDKLKEDVPYEKYEKGYVVVEKDGIQTVVREFSGTDRSATFSYKGLRAMIAPADSVYVIHTHPFTSDRRHPGDHVVIPPSMTDLVYLAIGDVQKFVVDDIYAKFVYVVVDDARNVWRFQVINPDARFVSSARTALLSQGGYARELASASGPSRERFFTKMFSGYEHPEHLEEFFLALKATQRQPSEKAARDYIAAAAKLGISVTYTK
jgi:hypothetical protein